MAKAKARYWGAKKYSLVILKVRELILIGRLHKKPVVSTERIPVVSTELLWCYTLHWQCKRRAEKGCTKWIPGKFPAPLLSLAEICSCPRRLFWKTRSFNYCAVVYFAEMKWLQEGFEASSISSQYFTHLLREFNIFERGNCLEDRKVLWWQIISEFRLS